MCLLNLCKDLNCVPCLRVQQAFSRLSNSTLETPASLAQVAWAASTVIDMMPDVGIWALLDTHLPLRRTSPKLGALSKGCSGKIYTDEKSQPPNSFFKEAKQIWWFILCHSDPSICSTSGKWDRRDGSANIKLKETLSGFPTNSRFLFKATE